MTLKNNLKYIATPSKIITTTVIILSAIYILQAFAIAISMEMDGKARKKASKQVVKEPEKELTEEEKKLEIIKSTQKRFLSDGTLFHVKYPERRYFSDGIRYESIKMKIYDEDTNPLWEGPANNNPYDFISWLDKSTGFNTHINYSRLKTYKMITPELSRSIQIPVRSKKKILQVWQYNWEKGYFKGYTPDGRKPGYLGSAGFTRSNAESLGTLKDFTAWCPEDSYSPTLLWQTKRKIYRINFEKQQFKLLFESPDSDIEINGWQKIQFSKEKTSKPPHRTTLPSIQCQTEDGKLYLITLDPEKTLAINLPKDQPKETYPWQQLSATKAGIFLRRRGNNRYIPKEVWGSIKLIEQWREKIRKEPTRNWVELYKVDNQGDLELIKRYDWTEPPEKYQTSSVRYHMGDTIRHYVRSVSPILYDLPWKIYGMSIQKFYRENTFSGSLLRATNQLRPNSSILSWILTALMASLVVLHAWPRRTTWQRLIFWTIFTLAFNLAGLLTYLALNHTTVIKCKACGKRRGLERTDCIRCTAELPTPEKRKTNLILQPQG